MDTGYYIGNAFYDYVDKKMDNFVYAKENLWLLVYGNKRCEPKVIIVLSALDKESYKAEKFSPAETEIVYYATQISEKSGIPWIYVSFIKDEKKLSKVKVYSPKKDLLYKEISPDELAEIYKSFDLFIVKKESGKTINKQYSNVYQKWQMTIGYGLTGSDIDIMKVKKGNIESVYELKRSHIAIEKWRPYPADFHNFVLLSKLFLKCGIKFYIVYNYRKETPFFDDISKLKVYKIDASKRNFYEEIGIFSTNEFFNKDF